MYVNTRSGLCTLCGVVAHALPACPRFIALPIKEWYDEVRRLTRCLVCLGMIISLVGASLLAAQRAIAFIVFC